MTGEDLLAAVESLFIFGFIGCTSIYNIYVTSNKIVLIVYSFLGVLSFYISIWAIIQIIKYFRKKDK